MAIPCASSSSPGVCIHIVVAHSAEQMSSTIVNQLQRRLQYFCQAVVPQHFAPG